jgi:transketolase
MRPAVRLAALMNIPSIFVWTHDSIALGEDGPTHQPIEQLATLRAIPNLAIVRPADANEVAWTWLEMLRRREGPSGIALTRQALPVLQRGTGSATSNELAAAHFAVNGAYILAESSSAVPDVILIATGSEVHLAIGAREQLELDGIGVRVVSAPCLEWFAEQSEEYQELVLPGSVRARVSVEAGLSLGWHSLVGDKGKTVSIEHFGASADYKTLFDKFGMTVEAVVDAARASLKDLHSEAK